MPLYEHVFLARQDVSTQQVETLVQDFQKIITDAGGSIAKSEYWGLKGLSYKIKKNRKAHFSLFNIDATHEAVTEMERQMRLSSDVIRFMTIRVDEHETEPSAPMRRSDRDDRRGGRDDHRRGPRRDRDGGPREDRPRRDRDNAGGNEGDNS
ncbi:MAG: 30S ribosomal protein S6 [Pseudomonadota bacterium]|nr:30S ribosomal protein S6 [Pseudomonadota bacterium]